MTEPTSQAFRVGIVIPTYRHVDALPRLLAEIAGQGLAAIVVDDGNEAEIAGRIKAACSAHEGARYLRREQNGGKGAAVKVGFEAAADAGWTHVIQVDADGQHDIRELPALIALSQANPDAVVCAIPIYDDSVPKARKIGREITHFWVRVETLGFEISDSMCGFRVYPLIETRHVLRREFVGARMDFDTEILVQLNWRGLRVVEYPVRVTYPEENISNFRMLEDNVRISLMHTRLALQMPVRVPVRMLRRAFLRRYRK